MYFEHPLILILLIPAILAGVYFFKKSVGKKQKVLISSRAVIAIILIIALANPIAFMSVTRTDMNPNLVIISDETESMRFFAPGAGQELYQFFSDRFHVQFDVLAGNTTALGEKIAQHADGRNQILMVTDGNSNLGLSLEEAIDIAIMTNTTVSAVVPALIRNDLSVELTGDKTIIYGNVHEFGFTVRQAAETQRVTYNVVIRQNGQVIHNETLTMEEGERERTALFQTRFMRLGAHVLEATLTSTADTDPINNVFTKSIYAIERPNVILVSSERNAPLAQVLGSLYNVTVVESLSVFGPNLGRALSTTKVVVMDNVLIDNITESDVAHLSEFVSEGGGLFVVGGRTSFDLPVGHSYLGSSFERLLPVISIPSDWEGMQDVFIFIDVSDSTSAYDSLNQGPIFANMKATAVNIIENEFFRDANITYFTIGDQDREWGGEFFFMGNPRERAALIHEIENLRGWDRQTNLIHTFNKALPVMEERAGQPLIIIISDGMWVSRGVTYSQLLRTFNQAYQFNATIVTINIYNHRTTSLRENQFRDASGNIFAQTLMRDYRGHGIYIESNQGLSVFPNFPQLLGEGGPDEIIIKNIIDESSPAAQVTSCSINRNYIRNTISVDASVHNFGGNGTVVVWATIYQGNNQWTRSQTLHMNFRESVDVTFTFREPSIWGSMQYRVWVENVR
jgi:hypothetical protein